MAKIKNPAAKRAYKNILDYQGVFSSAQGKAVLYDLMRTHNVLDSTYTKDQNDIYIKEGERRVILRILNLMKINPNTYLERIEQHEKNME